MNLCRFERLRKGIQNWIGVGPFGSAHANKRSSWRYAKERQVKKPFDWPAGLRVGDYTKSSTSSAATLTIAA
jgi:hypothetical protein